MRFPDPPNPRAAGVEIAGGAVYRADRPLFQPKGPALAAQNFGANRNKREGSDRGQDIPDASRSD